MGVIPISGKRAVVFGSTGQLGSDVVEALERNQGFDVVPLSHSDADCADRDAVCQVLHSIQPHIVINCAAFVRVDDCENRPEEAFRVNAVGASQVARACADVDALCAYVSTDYVFDGTKGNSYLESDVPNPINIYGTSKLAGEHLVRQAASRWLIVRVASLFGKAGARGKGGNFVEHILAKARSGERLRVVDDLTISPTYSRDAARVLLELIRNGNTGIFHLANQGACTWYEFAKEIVALSHLRASIEPVSSEQFGRTARRPKNSALATDKGHRLPPWRDALAAYLMEKLRFPETAR